MPKYHFSKFSFVSVADKGNKTELTCRPSFPAISSSPHACIHHYLSPSSPSSTPCLRLAGDHTLIPRAPSIHSPAMGCSTSKLEPKDQLDASAPSHHRRRGFASDLFGRTTRKNHHNGGKSGCESGDAAVPMAGRQHEEEQPRQGKKGGRGKREVQAGSPSFRYYCENAAAAAFGEHRGQAPTTQIWSVDELLELLSMVRLVLWLISSNLRLIWDQSRILFMLQKIITLSCD